jgi:hypothetical protein
MTIVDERSIVPRVDFMLESIIFDNIREILCNTRKTASATTAKDNTD